MSVCECPVAEPTLDLVFQHNGPEAETLGASQPGLRRDARSPGIIEVIPSPGWTCSNKFASYNVEFCIWGRSSIG